MRRKALDILMAVLMIFLMSYQMTGNLFHEAAGAVLLILFVIHNIINRKWYRNIPKGKYTGFRRMLLAVNVLTLVCMLAAMGTGIYISQSVFAPLLGMREAYLVRPFHVAAGAWGTIMISSHARMHVRLPVRTDGKEKQRDRKKAGKEAVIGRIFAAVCVLSVVLGGWAFVLLDMPARLTFQDTGMYWSYPAAALFFANAAVMLLFVCLAAAAANRLKKKK